MSFCRCFVTLVCMLVLGTLVSAQPAQPPAGGARQGRAVGGIGFNPDMRPDQLKAIRDQLDANDETWKTLSPLVEKVLEAKQKMSTGAGMSWQRSNNAKPVVRASDAKPDTAPGKAMQDVRDAVADTAATAADLTRKMAAVREARQKAKKDYENAQKALSDATTPRQQAVLMTLGVIE
jgi:hypothetical protein